MVARCSPTTALRAFTSAIASSNHHQLLQCLTGYASTQCPTAAAVAVPAEAMSGLASTSCCHDCQFQDCISSKRKKALLRTNKAAPLHTLSNQAPKNPAVAAAAVLGAAKHTVALHWSLELILGRISHRKRLSSRAEPFRSKALSLVSTASPCFRAWCSCMRLGV